MLATVIERSGGPEVLQLATVDDPTPGPGELLVRTGAVGVNYIDTYHRSGHYPVPLPFIPGREGAGTVTAVGSGVTEFVVGDRVAWADIPDSYAELVVVPASRALPVPGDVDDETAAALPLQGMTAHYLITSTYPVQPGDTVLVHAAAGGVGLLLVQLAKARGARVIGTVSTKEKEKLAREVGADEIIRYTEQEIATEVRRLTDGIGVAAVYDGVGASTFDASLASLRRRGVLVLFGASSGPVPPVDPQRLNSAGSLYLTRPNLGDYVTTRAELMLRTTELFEAVRAGQLSVRIGGRYPLAEAARAHEDLHSRRTTGKLLLLPSGQGR
jgi:NADPH2:quinone reductase